MRYVDVASQAGIFDSKMIASYVLSIAEKCNALQRDFSACSESFSHGRRQINQAEETMDSMQASLARFNGTLDGLGNQALQVRSTVTQRNAQIEKLKRDIALREDLLSKLQEQATQTEHGGIAWQLSEIRDDKINIEQQLGKVTRDIDQTFESISEVEDKLDKMKDLHSQRKQADQEKLAVLQSENRDVDIKRRNILSLRGDNVLNLTSLYTTTSQSINLQVELEELRSRQHHMERHIRMLLDEREHLKNTANEVIQRVHNLEMKARRETGDHGYNSYTSAEPNWYQDLGTPSVWQASRPYSIDQIKRLSDKQNPKYLIAQVVDATEAGPSSDTDHQLITVDLTGSSDK